MNRPSRWNQNSVNSGHPKLGSDTEGGCALFHAADAFFPALGVRRSLRRFPLRGGQSRSPPVVVGMKFLPQLPGFSRAFGKQVLARETHGHGKTLRAFSDQHDMAGVLDDRF